MTFFKEVFSGKVIFTDSNKYKLIDDSYYEVSGICINKETDGRIDGSLIEGEEIHHPMKDEKQRTICNFVFNYDHIFLFRDYIISEFKERVKKYGQELLKELTLTIDGTDQKRIYRKRFMQNFMPFTKKLIYHRDYGYFLKFTKHINIPTYIDWVGDTWVMYVLKAGVYTERV